MATLAPAPTTTTTTSEATFTFHNEPWTAESARLLLEIDEGWMGFRNDAAWSWHKETYPIFTVICRERKWSCNSKAACVAMLTALRTGAIRIQLNSATRSYDGHSQWSLAEMRELGAQMRRVVDGEIPPMPWAAQLVAFVETMKLKDVKYSIGDRTVEGFAIRAGKYVPDSILLQIDPNLMNGKTTPTVVTKTTNMMNRNTKKSSKTVTKTPNVVNGNTAPKKTAPMAVTKTPNVNENTKMTVIKTPNFNGNTKKTAPNSVTTTSSVLNVDTKKMTPKPVAKTPKVINGDTPKTVAKTSMEGMTLKKPPMAVAMENFDKCYEYSCTEEET
ncbi:Hypothetical protein PHPALM_12252 [Phytophthora palmivora]|uniref:Uncharacterized protein n=1 Tax=Phytophthora palmivora TaxID=4796 RepID=A0A2P4Y068_9STRA|nr:Hypothetical protein PHPALM_12252 [Phytophthora palmivora]